MKKGQRIFSLVSLATFLTSFLLFIYTGLSINGTAPGSGLIKQITEKQLNTGRFLQVSEKNENESEFEAGMGLKAQLITFVFNFLPQQDCGNVAQIASDAPQDQDHPIFLKVR